ncbi:prepilin-type N-terminal cleavage/methylation domain-containing protein [Alkalimarinus coralli]|uniref:prepilin-type N-terminal cleavage/methylation domain-containing protein n=1 Tax=Alkalimarinus coralli TaxID=2935863 RepID=UPI00202B3FAE|nr:prepilin-type N-terminal cleavage/methylation domain-containing protein [Alkalimarinus coralli]
MILHRNTNTRLSTGFTLIELVVVIAILSILSMFALSRYSDLRAEAELGNANYIAGSLKVGVDTVRLVFRAAGHSTRVQNLAGYGDGTVDTNNIGYPIGTTKGNGNENIGIGNAGCVGVWQGILDAPPSVSTTNGADYRSYRHTGNKVCSYVYRAGGDTGNRNSAQLVIRYDSRDGTVDVCGRRADIANC